MKKRDYSKHSQCDGRVPTPGMNFYRPRRCLRPGEHKHATGNFCASHHPDLKREREEQINKAKFTKIQNRVAAAERQQRLEIRRDACARKMISLLTELHNVLDSGSGHYLLEDVRKVLTEARELWRE